MGQQEVFRTIDAVPGTTRDEHSAKSADELRRENAELKDLVIELTKIVVRNVMER